MLRSVLIVACATCTICAPTDFALFTQNLESMQAFKCEKPQPRAFNAAKLLKDEISFSDKVVPHTAVLYRCDSNSGCCNDEFHTCTWIATEDVELVFLVHSGASAGHRYVTYHGKNHTMCGCKHAGSSIK